MKTHVSGFHEGLLFFVSGWRKIFADRSLRHLVWLPFLISGVLTFFTARYGISKWEYLKDLLLNSAGEDFQFVMYIVLIVGAIVSLIFLIYLAYVLQTIVAIPFHSLLAEKVLEQSGKRSDAELTVLQKSKRTIRQLRIGMVKATLFIFFGVILFLFSLIPFLQIVTFPCAMLLVAFDCIDYSFEALDFGLRERFIYVVREWSQWFGMASALGLTLFLPGLTLLVIPGAVVGAALIIKAERR